MARDDERDELEHQGYRSGRVRIVGAEPAGPAAHPEDDATSSWEDRASEPWDSAVEEDERQGQGGAPAVPPLPHWTEPATGEVPAILSRDSDTSESDPFATVSGPTWREEGSDWAAADDDYDPSMLAGDKTGQGSLDTGPSDRQPWVFDLPASAQQPSGIFADEGEWEDDEDSAWNDLTRNAPAPSWVGEDAEDPITEVIPVVSDDDDVEPVVVSTPAPAPPIAVEPQAPGQVAEGPAVIGDRGTTDDGNNVNNGDDGDVAMGEPRSRFRSLRSERRLPSPARRASPPRRPADRLRPPPGTTPEEAPARNVLAAVGSGLVLGGIALITFKIGTVAAVALVTVIVAMAAAEAYAAFRQGGYHPVTLLGLVATVSLMIAAYNKGEAALPLVLVLLAAFCFVWHLAGVESTDTVRSIGTTLFVFVWVGVFGSFGALLLSPSLFPHRHGIAFLLGGVIAAVAYDVGALTFGAWLGRHPMASASPNKTWEGFVGGLVTSLILSVVIVHLIAPWTVGKAAVLGLVVSVVAAIGDLFESTVKRHLGRKDMGRLLPGHGGILDRVDGLLFALPATFYLVIAFHLG